MKSLKSIIFIICFSLKVLGNADQLYKVTVNGRVGLINSLGELVVKPEYEKIGCENGSGELSLELINKLFQGRTVLPCIRNGLYIENNKSYSIL